MNGSLYKPKGSWTTELWIGSKEILRVSPFVLGWLAFAPWTGRYAAYCVLRGLMRFGPGTELGMPIDVA